MAFEADVSALKTDAAAGLWFTSGEDLADLLTLAIGPNMTNYISPTPELYGASIAKDILAVPEFVAGLLFGITSDSNLPEIQTCYEGGELVITKVQQIMANLEDGDLVRSAKYIK